MQIDHIVIAAETLDAGSAAVADALGVRPVDGGKHPIMGTHNRLLSLGSGAYLEVIAIDPDAPAPERPRWFGLDRFSGPPRLSHWAIRTSNITGTLAEAPMGMGEVVALSRGDLSWKMAIPPSGELPFDGVMPALLTWNGAMAADLLPQSGLTLQRLVLTHPRMGEIRAAWPRLASMGRVTLEVGPRPEIRAEIVSAEGLKTLRGVIAS